MVLKTLNGRKDGRIKILLFIFIGVYILSECHLIDCSFHQNVDMIVLKSIPSFRSSRSKELKLVEVSHQFSKEGLCEKSS